MVKVVFNRVVALPKLVSMTSLVRTPLPGIRLMEAAIVTTIQFSSRRREFSRSAIPALGVLHKLKKS